MSGKDYGPNCDLLPDDLLKEARQRTLSKAIPDTVHGLIEWLEQRKNRVTSS